MSTISLAITEMLKYLDLGVLMEIYCPMEQAMLMNYKKELYAVAFNNRRLQTSIISTIYFRKGNIYICKLIFII